MLKMNPPKDNADIERRILPHTGLQVPTGDVPRVTSLRSMETRDGEAFRAVVRVRRTQIGELFNEGRGGGTEFFSDSREGWEAMSHFMSRCLRRDGEDATSLTFKESLFDDLVEEYDNDRHVKRAQKAGKHAVRGIDEDGYSGPTADLTRWPITDPNRQRLVAELDEHYTGRAYTWQVWFEGAWHPLAPNAKPTTS